ncbi:MAG TPA: CRTAC1 family protein [Opitutaceae bacterium]|nr:CRTAC1 family protein [Opitutaceae bacterium]
MPPIVPVLAPLVVAAIVIAFIFSRYLSAFAPAIAAPTVHFTDVTTESGLNFVQDNGTRGEDGLPPSTLGSGVAILDYDKDGAADIFFVNGREWSESDDTPPAGSRCALFRNDGHGHFTDVSAAAKADIAVQGMGVAVGDYDNDGYPDLFITTVGENRLLHNRGDGTFEEVGEKAGVAGEKRSWSTGALWLDLDGDGRLDLIVCRYTRWSQEIELNAAFNIAAVGRSYGTPAGFVSASPLVYRNLGDGRFVEEAARFGLSNISPDTRLPRPEPLGVAPVDSNGDGKIDLLFVYHAGEPTLFLNEGGGHFREWRAPSDRREGSASLIAFNAFPMRRNRETSDAVAALGATYGRDAASNSEALRLGPKLGMAMFDYDLDGHLEIFSPNGRAEPELSHFEAGRNFASTPTLLWDWGNGWAEANLLDGNWASPLVARGIATADFDGDGDLDVIVTQNGGAARLLRNDEHVGNAWLRIELVGTSCARDASGARVDVYTPRHTITHLVAPAMGYLSQSEHTLTFGLGEDSRVRRVTVTWPDGKRQDVTAPAINRRLIVTEPK